VLLLLLASLGGEGEDEGCLALLLCWRGPGAFFELIIADAFIASVILYRQGGNSSTSMLEACSRHCRGCSNSLRGEVIRSPHRRKGPRWMSVVGRGLPSSWSLPPRTPAKGGDDTQGPDCFLSLCSWVFFVKEMALSEGWAFPRTVLPQGCFCNLYSPRDQWPSRPFYRSKKNFLEFWERHHAEDRWCSCDLAPYKSDKISTFSLASRRETCLCLL
jgi:hypothetical protein